jgi:hypothetical protein
MSHDNPLALAFLGDAIWSVSSSNLTPAAASCVGLAFCSCPQQQSKLPQQKQKHPGMQQQVLCCTTTQPDAGVAPASCMRCVTLHACTLAQHSCSAAPSIYQHLQEQLSRHCRPAA